jgi:NAD(P)-dependent dehydrogenase (short-subunit alcohol dehydrogenase family)
MGETMRFDGRVALITGAGRGIGAGYARLLSERGATVVVNDLGGAVDGTGESSQPAEDLAAHLRADGATAVADTHSVATEAGASALVHETLDRFGRVDILIHNAGFNIGSFEAMLDLHLRAAHWLSEGAWPGMVEQNYGRIVLTTSAAGLYGDGTGPGPNPKLPYATAKMGVVGLTKALAVRGAPVNIKVNAVSPTADTRLVGRNSGIVPTRPGAPPAEATISWVRRFAPVDLVARGAAWLMHEDCPVSGRVFAVGAGRVAEVFIAVTRGLISPDLQPEDVLENLDQVVGRIDAAVPLDMADYAAWMRETIG